MKKIIFSICVALVLTGCVGASSRSGAPVGGNDGYVPWWVEDGVPNAEGVIVK